jgi:dTDP-4-dehydrorhamnose reductase
LDVRYEQRVLSMLDVLQPAALVNCIDNRAEGEMWLANVVAAAFLAGACAERGIAFVQISTARVFGEDRKRLAGVRAYDPGRPEHADASAYFAKLAHTEDDAPCPSLDRWAISKLAAEQAVLRVAIEFPRFRWFMLRTGCLVERPCRPSRNLLYRLTEQLYGRRSTIVAASDAVMQLTYVPHLAHVIDWLLANRDCIAVDGGCVAPAGIYHVVNSGLFTPAELLRELSSATGRFRDVESRTCAELVRSGDVLPGELPPYTGLNTAKYEATGGPQPPSWGCVVKKWAAIAQEHFI